MFAALVCHVIDLRRSEGTLTEKKNEISDAVPVLEEALHVEKTEREVDRILIKKSVRERTEYADLELRSGEATIERVPVNRIVDAPQPIREDGDTTIVPIVEEIMVVEKRLFLKEEIRIRRQERVQHVRQPVLLRSEEVSLERQPDANQNLNPEKD
jgi:uncharacterized protein (TIGR02271 family)